MKYKLRNFVEAVSETEPSPQNSQFDRFVGLEHYDSGEIEITRYTDTSLLSSSVKIFRANDILIARRNVYLKRAGIVFFDGLTSGDSIILRVLKDCERGTGVPYSDALRWLPLILNSSAFWAYANKHADGMNSKRISKEMLLDYEFGAPSIETIRSIADKVWSAHSLKKRYRKLLDLTDEMVKSRFIEEFNNPEIPKVSMSELCTTFIDGDWIEAKDQSDSGYRLVQTGNVGVCEYVDKEEHARFVSEDTFKRLNCTEIHPGDILFSRLPDPIGRCCLIPRGFQKAITAVDCTITRLKDSCLPEYLMVYTTTNMYSEQIKTCVTGTTRQRISRGNLAKIQVPLPSTERQQSFVDLVHQADKSKFELKQAIEKIDKVMRALLQ